MFAFVHTPSTYFIGFWSFFDTIRLCHEMGSDLPVFVARDLASLPPVTADCFDVSSLLRDVENIKLELRALGDMSKIAAGLSSAVNTMKEMTHVMHVHTTIHPPGDTDTTLPTETLSSTVDANRTSPCEISVGLADDGPMLVGTTMASTTQTPARVVKTRRNDEPNDKPDTTRTLAQVVSTLRYDATTAFF